MISAAIIGAIIGGTIGGAFVFATICLVNWFKGKIK